MDGVQLTLGEGVVQLSTLPLGDTIEHANDVALYSFTRGHSWKLYFGHVFGEYDAKQVVGLGSEED